MSHTHSLPQATESWPPAFLIPLVGSAGPHSQCHAGRGHCPRLLGSHHPSPLDCDGPGSRGWSHRCPWTCLRTGKRHCSLVKPEPRVHCPPPQWSGCAPPPPLGSGLSPFWHPEELWNGPAWAAEWLQMEWFLSLEPRRHGGGGVCVRGNAMMWGRPSRHPALSSPPTPSCATVTVLNSLPPCREAAVAENQDCSGPDVITSGPVLQVPLL